MTVRAEQIAFGGFGLDLHPAPVCERSRVELKGLARRVAMMEFKSGEVPCVSTSHALTAHHADKSRLVDSAAFELSGIALLMVVGVSILAGTGAKGSLPATKW
jgi:hypothetical protein